MTRLPRVSGKEVLSTLRQNGFEVVHVRGSHHYLRKPASGKLVVVPVHGSSTIPTGTLKSILRQAELTTSEFERMINDQGAFPFSDGDGRDRSPAPFPFNPDLNRSRSGGQGVSGEHSPEMNSMRERQARV